MSADGIRNIIIIGAFFANAAILFFLNKNKHIYIKWKWDQRCSIVHSNSR